MLSPYRFNAGATGASTSDKPLLVQFADAGYTFVDGETPAGTIDGANVTFTLTQSPDPAASLELYLNRVLMVVGTDFTLAGDTITFTGAGAPQVGDLIRAWFRY